MVLADVSKQFQHTSYALKFPAKCSRSNLYVKFFYFHSSRVKKYFFSPLCMTSIAHIQDHNRKLNLNWKLPSSNVAVEWNDVMRVSLHPDGIHSSIFGILFLASISRQFRKMNRISVTNTISWFQRPRKGTISAPEESWEISIKCFFWPSLNINKAK